MFFNKGQFEKANFSIDFTDLGIFILSKHEQSKKAFEHEQLFETEEGNEITFNFEHLQNEFSPIETTLEGIVI